MVKKVTYDEMFPHLRRIEEHYGFSIFYLSTSQIVQKLSPEYQKDWQVIEDFAAYSKDQEKDQYHFWDKNSTNYQVVSQLVKQGYFAKEIAQKLGLTFEQVRNHIAYDKDSKQLYRQFQDKRKKRLKVINHQRSKRIGKRIIAIQASQQLDLDEFAKKTGIQQQTLDNWEKAKTNPIKNSKSKLAKIAKLGHMALEDLIE